MQRHQINLEPKIVSDYRIRENVALFRRPQGSPHRVHCASTRHMDILACLHDQNKSGFFGGPAFIQPIRTI